jgi:hypothetical protein
MAHGYAAKKMASPNDMSTLTMLAKPSFTQTWFPSGQW